MKKVMLGVSLYPEQSTGMRKISILAIEWKIR